MLYGLLIFLGALFALDIWHSRRALRSEREARARIEAIRKSHAEVA